MKGSFEATESLQGYLHEPDTITGHLSLPTGGSGGTSDYKQLYNKPKINGVTLDGDISSDDLGIDSDGIYVGGGEMPEGCNVQIDPTGEASGIVEDVKINDTSIVSNGVANIPVASANDLGVIKTNDRFGLKTNANGELYGICSTTHINSRQNYAYIPLLLQQLDYAVKQALTDGKGEAYTQQEKASARDRLGCEWRYIGKVETQEDVVSMVMALDSEGKPFSLRKVYLKAVNYPNANDYGGWVIPYFNNIDPTVFNSAFPLEGVKKSETSMACEIIVEKICDKLIPTSIFKSINKTTASNVMTSNVSYSYNTTCTTFDGFINEIKLSGYQASIGAGAYMEIWGVDA